MPSPSENVAIPTTTLLFVQAALCITLLSIPLLSCSAAQVPESLKIIVLGDSLTAGYELNLNDAFPARLQHILQAEGWQVTVINAGVSGDTTAGGLARLDWILEDSPDLLILQLGANDALRGLAPEMAEKNLDEIILRAKTRDIRVFLAGMRAPLNLGARYRNEFNPIYPRLAEKHKIPLYPFFLEGVAGKPDLNLADGIHPNTNGVQVMAEGFSKFLRKHL